MSDLEQSSRGNGLGVTLQSWGLLDKGLVSQLYGVAGIFGAVTVNRSIILVQGLP